MVISSKAQVTSRCIVIVDITAEKGDQVMKDLVFEMLCEVCLGECALVPDPSPISQSGITFFQYSLMKMLLTTWLLVQPMRSVSVVYGENFSGRRAGSKAGLNRSDVHVDFDDWLNSDIDLHPRRQKPCSNLP